MFNEITKYEERSKDFDNWFKDVTYDEVEDGIWYKKIEGPVINHLAQRGYTWFACHEWWFKCSINECKIYKELMAIAGLEYSEEDSYAEESNVIPPERCQAVLSKYEKNICTAREKLFKEIDEAWLEKIFNKKLDNFKGEYEWHTPAQFVYGEVDQKNWCTIIARSYYDPFGNNYKFRAAIFKIVKKLDSFKEKAKTKPEVDFYNLIRSESFANELKDYFAKTNDERKSHKLKKLFSYVPEKSINANELSKINPNGYGYLHSVAYDEIHRASNEPLSPYYCPYSELVFYSLVEFYGKDFFDKLPKKEKDFIRDFYKNNPEFKLSDPSIIENFGDKNKPVENKESDLDLRTQDIEENSVEQNLSINEGKILTTDNNATYKNKQNQISNSNAEFIEENSGKENLPTDKNKIKNQSNNFVTNNDTKLNLVLNTKVIEKNLGKQNLFTDKNEMSMTDNNIKLKSKSSDTNTLNNIGSSKNKQSEILNSNTKVIKKNLINQNLSTNKNEISKTNHESKKIKKSYTKARVGTVILGISFVLSLILAWQISIYILIASAILLTMLIICLIALKKSGFECTKIFCCCMDVEDEPEIEIPKDNNLSNPKLNKAEKLID